MNINMTPMEAYRIISGCMDELVRMRLTMMPKAEKAWSEDEIVAQVIAFQALRRMEENDDGRK